MKKSFCPEDETISKIEMDFIIPDEATEIDTEEFFRKSTKYIQNSECILFSKGYLNFMNTI